MAQSWKDCMGVIPSWVQIPPPPPKLCRNEIMVNDSFIKFRNDLASVDCGPKLINQFSWLDDFIPNKWFDWKTVSNRDAMIVGQGLGAIRFSEKSMLIDIL